MASSKISVLKKLGISAAVGGVAVLGTPLVVSAAGFGAAGIAAGTLAAKLMTLTTTYGAGACVVGLLQSIGAAGTLSAAQAIITYASFSGVTFKALNSKNQKGKKDEGKDDKKEEPKP